MDHVVEFYYDISCPFAYIASTRIESLATRTSTRILWRPVLLGAIYRATNAPQGAAGSASDVFNPAKKAVTSRAFQRTIERLGVEYRQPPKHPVKTTSALRLLYHVDGEDRVRLSKGLYRAYWVEGRDVSNRDVLVDVVRSSGIEDKDEVMEAVRSGKFEGDRERKALEEATADAIGRGAFGVPGFWVGDEVWMDRNGEKRKGRLYWGQDRMQFVEAVLMAMKGGRNGESLGRVEKPLMGLMPRCRAELGIAEGEEVKMEFWYDFSSPWAFLGWTQLARLRRQFGERLQIVMKPFLLGILFREIGAPNLPMAAISEAKRDYSQLDHMDWCRWWNAVNEQEGNSDGKINFHWADIFPIRTPTVLRAVLVEPQLVGVLFRACWERNLDVSSDDVLRQVIEEAGFDASGILTQANSAQIKNDLRARTKEAKDTGICGVPSYRSFRRKVGQIEWKQTGDIVWGQDELAVVEDLIAGWQGNERAQVRADVGRGGQARL